MEDWYISGSAIAGRGLFTAKTIEPGECILRFEGERISHEYTPEFAKIGSNWIGVGDREWIIPSSESPVLFLNHCCEPNVFINEQQEVIAAQVITAHSELLLDYSSTELDPFWTMRCTCNHPTCRKLIKSFVYLSAVKQLKYKPYISPVYWQSINHHFIP